jgi:hypothetical protein
MVAFTKLLNSGKSKFEKVKNLTDSPNNVFLAADGKKMIKIFHSPKNFGRMLLCPSNKVVCLTGLGRLAKCVQLDSMLVVTHCKLVTPTIVDFLACLVAHDVSDLQVPSAEPENGGFYSYEGSNMMLPAPWLQDTILNTVTQDPFELIPIALTAAKAYNDAHNTVGGGRAIIHADNFCSWAWGAGVGRVKESIIKVNADVTELETYCSSPHCKCITRFSSNTGNQQAGNSGAYVDVLRQLTASIVHQTEEAAMSNQLSKNKIERKREHDDEKKDRSKKIHKSIIGMLENTAAASALEVDLELMEGCQKILNANTKGSAEQDLSNQFDKLNLTDIYFAQGIVQ